MRKMAIELTGQWSSGRSKGRVLLPGMDVRFRGKADIAQTLLNVCF
jgi:hypothetical protein